MTPGSPARERGRYPMRLWRRGAERKKEEGSSMADDSAQGAHEVQVNGITLHYAAWGTPAGPDRTVVLVHGITASHMEWARLGPLLARQGYHVLAPDLRGRGLSGKPPHGYGIPFHANDLLGLADALGLASFHVVGHSLGAVIGMFLAAIYPSRLGKLIMVDAGGKIPADTAQAIAASVNRLGTVYPSLEAYLALARQMPMFQWNDFWDAYFRYDADILPDGTVASRVPKAAIEEENAVLYATRTEDLPAFVKQPTLIVRAALGTLGPDRGVILPAEEAERLRGIIPDCRVVTIPETNHYTIILSDACEQAIADFLGAPS